MPPTRIIPDAQTLRRMVASGMTHQEIADLVGEETGTPVTRGAVSSAISRAGLSAQGRRYDQTLPWRVKIEHSKHYAARMLRLLGRRQQGLTIHPADEARLDAWLDKMSEEGAVVAYIPETEEGFHYMDPPRGWRDEGAPIIVKTIRLDEVGKSIQW